jgi:surface carbohydrate biosynthesis protein
MRSAQHVLASLCAEGLVYLSPEHYINRRVYPETIRLIDCLMIWGERQNREMREAFALAKETRITGHPSFDLLHPKLREIWRDQADAIQKAHGDFVLITSRFGNVNHKKWSISQFAQRRKEGYSGAASDSAETGLHFAKAVFDKYCADVGETIRKLGHTQFLVRPHPKENRHTWEERLAGSDNATVVQSGPAIPWLLAARAVIHNGCTTGIEAHILGTPAIEYHPASIGDSEFQPPLPGKVTGRATSVDDLIRWIETGGEGDRRERRDDVAALLKDYLYGSTDGTAYLNVADALERLADNAGRLVADADLAIDADAASEDRFDVEEVNGLLRRLAGCLGQSDLRAYRHGPYAVAIR